MFDFLRKEKGPVTRAFDPSGRPDSNWRPSPWQGDALPLSHARKRSHYSGSGPPNQRFQAGVGRFKENPSITDWIREASASILRSALDKDPATATPALPASEGFRNLAQRHRADLDAIRERNRRRRLRYLLYLNLLILGYLVARAVEGRPLEWGLPELGPDAMLWLFPVLILLMFAGMLALPLINGRSPHIRFTPDQIGMTFNDVRGIDVVLEEVSTDPADLPHLQDLPRGARRQSAPRHPLRRQARNR